MHILEKLYAVLQERKGKSADKSYAASLYAKGASHIAEKITEEAEETIQEALRLEKSPEDETIREALRQESADLIFHHMVMLAHHNIAPGEVFKILEERFGISGHDEKAARSE